MKGPVSVPTVLSQQGALCCLSGEPSEGPVPWVSLGTHQWGDST